MKEEAGIVHSGVAETVAFDWQKLTWFIVGLLLGVALGVGGMVLNNRTRPAAIIIAPPEPTAQPEPTATAGPIRVYVNGQVVAPAVYELPPGSIVAQAVEAAGGFTAEANTAVVNLAQSLVEGAQIYVPANDEVVAQPVNVVSSPVTSANPSGAAATGSTGLININTAGLEELDTLPGVGPSTAQKIIEHRDANGPFPTIEAIMDVSGIGEAKFNQIKELITVEGG
jgi:competence protein ComEA